MKLINPGKYNKAIEILKKNPSKDKDGFYSNNEIVILKTYANVKTTRGFTLLINNSDFEKAYTNFTIRYPKVLITKDMTVKFKENIYEIEYLNNIDEENIELEIQCKLIKK